MTADALAVAVVALALTAGVAGLQGNVTAAAVASGLAFVGAIALVVTGVETAGSV